MSAASLDGCDLDGCDTVRMVDDGHTVLAVPVPELNDVVRSRTAHYDPDYLAADPEFGQAHITVLGPWVRRPNAEDQAVVEKIVSDVGPFTYRLERTGVFPNGIIHLLPEPAQPFAKLTADVCAQFPANPPYGGQFSDPVPHLTLDTVGPDVDEARVRQWLGDRLPVSALADRLQLQWWQAGHCHAQRTWLFGS